MFWANLLTINHKVHFHCLLWIVFIFSRVETFFGFKGVFLCALEGSHLLADIKWLLVRSAYIAQHCRLVIRCTVGGFVEDEAFILTQDSLAVAVDFGWGFKETFFGLLFRGQEIFDEWIVVVYFFRFIVGRRQAPGQLTYFLFIDFHINLSNL